MLSFKDVTTADGVRLNVVESGNPQGPAIVFVHGISQSWLSWIAQLADPVLRAKYRLIAFDLRGHGASQGSQIALDSSGVPLSPLSPNMYGEGATSAATAALWASDLKAVLDGLALLSPTVVGWSYGATVVQDYIASLGGLAAIGKVMLLAGSPVLLPAGTPDGGTDMVFSNAAIGALVATTTVNPLSGHINTHAEIASGLCGFVQVCYTDTTQRAVPTAAKIQGATGFNLFTPAAARLAILGRAYDYRASLAALSDTDKARIRVVVPLGDNVLQPTYTRSQWDRSGLEVDVVANEGHLYHDANPAAFQARLIALAG